jgi:hypothetical protein
MCPNMMNQQIAFSNAGNQDISNNKGFLVVISILFLMISYTPYHYWDEFYYIYTLNYHSLTETILKENDLSAGLFPKGFFSSKIGSMLIIWLFTKIMGAGWLSLYILQFTFALFLIGFFLVSYKFYSEFIESEDSINSKWALFTSTIVLFLPVTMYLSFKTLTEVPALFFTTFGLWMFIRSIRETAQGKICILLSLAFAGIVLGALCRYLFLINFIGFVFSYVIIYRKHYLIRTIIKRAMIIFAGLIMLVIFVFYLKGDHLIQSVGLLKFNIMDLKSGDNGVKIYVFMMYFQSFIILLPFSFLFKWTKTFKLSICWLCISVIPLFAVASYLETRFFSIGLLPTAIIMNQGLQNFEKSLRLHKRIFVWIFLMLIVISNRLVFTPLSLYDIDQKHLKKIVSDVYQYEPQATLILPWITEYCLLRFVYPDREIRSSITTLPGTENHSFIQTDSFKWWIGRTNHVSMLEELLKESKPWIYIGRSFSPAREKLYEYLSMLRMSSLMQRRVGSDPLSLSWIWNNEDLKLDLSQRQGPYNAYQIEFSQRMK